MKYLHEVFGLKVLSRNLGEFNQVLAGAINLCVESLSILLHVLIAARLSVLGYSFYVNVTFMQTPTIRLYLTVSKLGLNNT